MMTLKTGWMDRVGEVSVRLRGAVLATLTSSRVCVYVVPRIPLGYSGEAVPASSVPLTFLV